MKSSGQVRFRLVDSEVRQYHEGARLSQSLGAAISRLVAKWLLQTRESYPDMTISKNEER